MGDVGSGGGATYSQESGAPKAAYLADIVIKKGQWFGRLRLPFCPQGNKSASVITGADVPDTKESTI